MAWRIKTLLLLNVEFQLNLKLTSRHALLPQELQSLLGHNLYVPHFSEWNETRNLFCFCKLPLILSYNKFDMELFPSTVL